MRVAARQETVARLASTTITTATVASTYQETVTRGSMRPEQAFERADRDQDADEREKPGLGERREMLRLAVAVLVTAIGGTTGDAEREEREQRGDEIGTGVNRLRDEPEAVGMQADDELERDEQCRGRDRAERGAATWLTAPPAASAAYPGCRRAGVGASLERERHERRGGDCRRAHAAPGAAEWWQSVR